MTLEQQLIQFIQSAPFSARAVEREAGTNGNALSKSSLERTGISANNIINLIKICIKYGFVPSGFDTARWDNTLDCLELGKIDREKGKIYFSTLEPHEIVAYYRFQEEQYNSLEKKFYILIYTKGQIEKEMITIKTVLNKLNNPQTNEK